MTTLAELQARVRRLEQRQPRRWSGQAVCPVPADAAHLRTVLKMLSEAGAFNAPRPHGALWRLKTALGLEDNLPPDVTPGTGDPAGPMVEAAQRMGA